jgi:hypothetical protein
MRLTKIDATELFSFDELALGNLPERALVIVGPNGAGKTNASRLLEIVVAATERSATYSHESYGRLVQFASGRRLEAAPDTVSAVGIGIATTEEWENDLILKFVRAALYTSLLSGAASNFDRRGVQSWVDAIGPDDLDQLTRGRVLAELIDPTTGQWSAAYEFDVDGSRFRLVMDGSPSGGALIRADDAGQAVPVHDLKQSLDPDEERVPARPFALQDVLPPTGEGRAFVVDGGSFSADRPMRAWGSAAGITTDELQRMKWNMSWVLRLLFERGVTFLGDLRLPPRTDYSVEETGFDPSPADGSRVPLRLFRLKNGEPEDRQRFERIQELFVRLTGATFDVVLAAEGSRAGETPVTLRISPVVDRAGHDLPMEFAGAGLWEALLLSATLSDSTGRTVVLDEPARNLHPTLQRRLLDEVRGASGQFIVTTHSPYLVPTNSDSSTAVCRFALSEAATRAHFLPSDDDDPRLRKVLGESADARALLFTHGVVLVEGGTELEALTEWFAKSATAEKRGTPEALSVVLFSVDGDTGYGTLVRYLNSFGVPWSVVCDGAIFQFGKGRPQIFEQILRAEAAPDELVSILDADTAHLSFAALRDAGIRNGVFTLAKTWDPPGESLETYIESVAPEQLSAATKEVGRSKPRRGRQVAAATACPIEVDDLYTQILDRFRVP